MKKILSIVIPTHNRCRYARYSIMSILEMNLDVELVVSDTSVDDDLMNFVGELDLALYSNVSFVYRYNKCAFDMKGNHNYALSLATGDYVCLIGDDDSVSPFIISACEWMKRNKAQVLSQLVSANYVWPDFKTKFYGDAHAGRLYIARNLTKLEKLNCNSAFEYAMRNCAQGTDGLPKLYHGLVERALLERVKAKSGAYVHGSSPDFSAAIALTQFCSNFYQTTFPLTIPGASGGSNTGRSALNKHKGNLADEDQTKSSQDRWEKEIPPFFSVETVWADACFKTLDALDVQFKSSFNFYSFYARLLVYHFDRRSEILNCFKYYISECDRPLKISYASLCFNVFKVISVRLLSILKRLVKPSASNGKFFYDGLETVLETPGLTKDHVVKREVISPFNN